MSMNMEINFESTSNHHHTARDDGKPTQKEPIAIIGMACRLPGGISSDADLWTFLCEGRSAQGRVPPSRYAVDSFFNSNNLPDSIPVDGGYFIDEDIRLFDNKFFGINNLEAEGMDPQQRKLLEVCYECMENAGVNLQEVAGQNIGCYVANFAQDFQAITSKDPGYQPRLHALGMGAAIMANRVSFAFDLRGPSLTMDTACSSSLYSLDLAVQALQDRRCDAAIVAGANLIQSHDLTMLTARLGVLSTTSTCHTFDSSADGYGRADGACALYVKRLSDAIRDKDPIRTIIRGTAVNSNGRTQGGITAPSIEGQCEVIRKAYAEAGLHPKDTDFVECHGTGTQAGDSAEVNAVAKIMRSSKAARPILIGSVKTNLGHSEAVSGITSIIKVALALENLWIPPTIGITRLNPKIDWQNSPCQVVTSGIPWPGVGDEMHVPRASVNSFGYGGSNGHCILERYTPPDTHESAVHSEIYPILLPMSASTPFSLEGRLDDLRQSTATYSLMDLAHTLVNRRPKLSCRSFLIATDVDWKVTPTAHSDKFQSSSAAPLEPSLAYVFTGQGAQWPGMGSLLFQRFPIFRKTILELDAVLKDILGHEGWSLADLLIDFNNGSTIHLPTHSQTACTALQIGLVDLLKDWGISPQCVIGHSSGEIAAAYAAGQISASRAITIAYSRGILVSQITSPGAMIAAGMSEQDATSLIGDLELTGRLCVACINSPSSVTVSGDDDAISVFSEHLISSNTFVRKVKTSGKAYHSHHMRAIGELYEQTLKDSCNYTTIGDVQTSTVEMISTVTGNPLGPSDAASAGYWRRNLESPVQFKSALETLRALRPSCHIIEIGPHSALQMPIIDTLRSAGENIATDGLLYFPTLTRHTPGDSSMLALAGRLWCDGYDIDLNRVNYSTDHGKENQTDRQQPKVLHNLPKYRWCYGEPLWSESRLSSEYRFRAFGHDELLGSIVPGLTDSTHTWRNILRIGDVPWLADHKLDRDIVYPGAAYIVMALKALQQIHEVRDDFVEISNMRLPQALVLSEDKSFELFTELRRQALSNVEHHTASWSFTISTWMDGQTTQRAAGTISSIRQLDDESFPSETQDHELSEVPQSGRNWYRRFASIGLNHGPRFQLIDQVWSPRMRNNRTCRAKLKASTDVPIGPQRGGRYRFQIHPIALDAQIQTGIIADTKGDLEAIRPMIPTVIRRLRFLPRHRHPDPDDDDDDDDAYIVRTRSKPVAAGLIECSSTLSDARGRRLIEMDADASWYFGKRLRASRERSPLLRNEWVPDFGCLVRGDGEALTAASSPDGAAPASHLAGGTGTRWGELLRLIRLVGAFRCDCRVLMVSGSVEPVRDVWRALRGGSAHPLFGELTWAHGNGEGLLMGRVVEDSTRISLQDVGMTTLSSGSGYHVVVLTTEECVEVKLLDWLASDGIVLGYAECVARISNEPSLEHILTGKARDISVIRHQRASDPFAGADVIAPVVMITDPANRSFDTLLESCLERSTGTRPCRRDLSRIDFDSIKRDTVVIITIELRKPILSGATADQLETVQELLRRTSRLIWIIGGDLDKGSAPDTAATLGLARSAMLEQPTLSFQVLALDCFASEVEMELACRSVLRVLRKPTGPTKDNEFSLLKGLLCVSRCLPDEELNAEFNSRKSGTFVKRSLRGDSWLEMDIETPGLLDTLHFRERPYPLDLERGKLELEVMCISLNAKDAYTLSGKVKTPRRTFAANYSGIVRRVREGSEFIVGQHVVGCYPGPFGTVVQIPEAYCIRMEESETFAQVSGSLLVYATAIHALVNLANLQSHESVLIHSASGGVGMAAIRIASTIGATIYATVGTEEKRDRLIELGIPPERIFNSRDSSFRDEILKVTNRGVDVVLNSLTGDRLRAGLEVCAPFGRFIEIGKKDITDGGNINLANFASGLTFSAFDLTHYSYSEDPSYITFMTRLFRQAIDAFRASPSPPPKVFNAGQLPEAFRTFANSKRIGQICVSFEDQNTLVDVKPKRHKYRFSQTKTYLLIGCLGGLGRSLTRYMLENGARHFVFLGRSGTEKPVAQSLVDDLREHGACVQVVKGDIRHLDTILDIVRNLSLPIAGVVQAAMGLGESLFDAMTYEKWQSSLSPKIQGTWNIHHALEGHDSDLDFFLITSSLAGYVGTATESNYCFANSFLDHFAKYRRSMGKPAIAIGFGSVSEVGYLHENPLIGEILERRGLSALTEADFLDICDIALCSDADDKTSAGATSYSPARAHVITGLEGTNKVSSLRRGYLGAAQDEMADPRLSVLVHGGAKQAAADNNHSPDNDDDDDTSFIREHKEDGLSATFHACIRENDPVALVLAVEVSLMRKLSQLTLTPISAISREMTLASFGMDSMLAAEYRSFIYRALDVDVQFLTLMDARTTIMSLAAKIAAGLLEGAGEPA